MPEPGSPTTAAAPAALAEPTARVGVGTMVLLGAANLALWMAVLTPIQVLLPQQIAALDPAGKVASLGWITAVAAVGAIVACPVVGALSDRTTTRLGRRHPWILGSLLVVAAALAALAFQRSVVGVGVAWVVAQLGINGLYAGVTSVLPDRVPRSQRALVSGVVGLQLPLGLVLGGLLTTVLVHGLTAGYLVLAVLTLVLGLPLVLFTRDQPLARADRPAWSTRGFFTQFWVSPRRHPDFAWALVGRFAIELCGSVATLYLQYYLSDVVGVRDPASGVFELVLLYTAGILLTAMVAGRISDRTGRRKVFVAVAAVVMGVAMLLLVFGSTFGTAMVAATVLGIGFGVYLAVDTALITEVLPTARSRGKDLGVINLAKSAPQAFAPAIAAGILTAVHSYGALYGIAGLLAIIGAALVQPIKSVH